MPHQIGDSDMSVENFDENHFDRVTTVDIYRAEVRCGDWKMIGPAYPIDAFDEQDGDLLRLAIRKSLIKAHLIGDRSYVTGKDLSTFHRWTGEHVRVPISRRWEENIAQVTAALDGIEGLDGSDPFASAWPFHSPTDIGRTKIALSPARDEIPGPIFPVFYFKNYLQQVLSWCIRETLIPSITLDGLVYVFYSDVYGRVLSKYFEDEYEPRATWDGTYAETWSSRRRVTGPWLKPRGFKDAVRSDMFPRISLTREVKHTKNDKGEFCSLRAAYPEHVADRAAEKFQALYREDGFLRRFRRYRYGDSERDANNGEWIERLGSFGAHEVEWFRKFAAEGGVRLVLCRGEEYVIMGDLVYYDIFAAKIIEEQLGPGAGLEVDDVFEVMLDGTLYREWPWNRSVCLLRGGGTPADP